MKKPIIVLGAGGHAGVLVETALKAGFNILGFCDLKNTEINGFPQIPYLGNDSIIQHYSPNEIRLIIGIGAITVQKNIDRRNLFEHFKKLGFTFETLVHPSAVIATNAKIGEGAQVMAGVIIQPNCIIEENTIINTKASLDHDCYISHSVHVAPGVTMSGSVTVGENSMIGVGAVLIQSIRIAKNTLVRAGRTVTKNVIPTLINSN